MANEICIRIRFALNKNSKVLGLSFSRRDTFQPHAYYGLPNCILSRSNLVELWLTYECAMITKVDNSTPNDDRGQKSEAMFLVCSGIFLVAVDKSTIYHFQLQIPSSSIRFCEMAPSRNTELAEALALLGECYRQTYFFTMNRHPKYGNLIVLLPLVVNCILCNVYLEPVIMDTNLNILSWIHQYEFDEDEYWNKVEAPVRCLIHHLKTVEVAGLVIEKLVDSVSGIFAWAFHGVKEKEDIPKKEIYCPSSLVSDKACE
ncbi:hypothetical protein T459_20122 [Capsicum annuum]|uniref:Uncharacterized protein n=1 Tax=Capsicum annuum TaxID=4072 RepID=A0A2G2Z3J8_CAPAN|nr:hypothetical protein T459_20122 [Capsicum annuum]